MASLGSWHTYVTHELTKYTCICFKIKKNKKILKLKMSGGNEKKTQDANEPT